MRCAPAMCTFGTILVRPNLAAFPFPGEVSPMAMGRRVADSATKRRILLAVHWQVHPDIIVPCSDGASTPPPQVRRARGLSRTPLTEGVCSGCSLTASSTAPFLLRRTSGDYRNPGPVFHGCARFPRLARSARLVPQLPSFPAWRARALILLAGSSCSASCSA